jgi:hypothetical protein
MDIKILSEAVTIEVVEEIVDSSLKIRSVYDCKLRN